MDGFEPLSGVIVVAATNIPEAVDPALLRPGRISEMVYVGLPDKNGREAILRLGADSMDVADRVDYGGLADVADGLSGAEIMEAWNRAGTKAEARDARFIEMADLRDALETTPRTITREMIQRYESFRK
jgi:ATP-dependent 26S proteasome regulatory subunit